MRTGHVFNMVERPFLDDSKPSIAPFRKPGTSAAGALSTTRGRISPTPASDPSPALQTSDLPGATSRNHGEVMENNEKRWRNDGKP